MLNSLTNNFLWGGDGSNRKIVEVALKTCMLPKQFGGLGLMDVNLMSIKLSAKWIARSMGNQDYWPLSIHKNCSKFQLKDLKAWTGFNSSWEIFLSRRKFIYKGSTLVKGQWTSWDMYRDQLCYKDEIKPISYLLGKESLWIGLVGFCLNREDLLKAHKLWKIGINRWTHLTLGNRWDGSIIQGCPASLQPILINKLSHVSQLGLCPPNSDSWSINQVCCWANG